MLLQTSHNIYKTLERNVLFIFNKKLVQCDIKNYCDTIPILHYFWTNRHKYADTELNFCNFFTVTPLINHHLRIYKFIPLNLKKTATWGCEYHNTWLPLLICDIGLSMLMIILLNHVY